jgi:predicted Zn-dependent protease
MAGFFETLQRMSEGEEHHTPQFLSTHPDPGDREVQIKQLASEWQQKIDYKPLGKNPDDFLRMLDGIVYGENPRAGFVRNDMFYHPALAFQLPVPKDWAVLNTPERLAYLNGGKTACILLYIGKEKEPGIEADLFVKETKAVVIKRETSSVNGLGAEVVESTVGGGSDQLHLLSYFIKKGEYVYIIHSFTTGKTYPNFVRVFSETSRGFANVTDKGILDVKPRRVRVKAAPAAGTLKDVLLSMGVSEKNLEETSLMNGRTLSARIEKDSLLKIVE